MSRFANWQEALVDLAERMKIQYPGPGDYDGTQTDQVSIPAGTRLNVSLLVEKGWVAVVKRIVFDFAPNTTYAVVVNGQTYQGDNELPLSVPAQETNRIDLVITNANAVAVTYAWRVEAWTREKTYE